MLGAHENKEHRDVCAFSCTISIEVGTDTHAIALGAGVEWRRIQTDRTAIDSVAISPADVRNLPNQNSVCDFDVEHVLSESNFVYCDSLPDDVLLDRLEDLGDHKQLCLVVCNRGDCHGPAPWNLDITR